MKHATRRRFLAASGTAVSATLLGPLLLKADRALAASTFVRRNVSGMDASDPILVLVWDGIKAMKLLPSTNPRSWAYQAAIHGTTLPGSTGLAHLRAPLDLLLVVAPDVPVLVRAHREEDVQGPVLGSSLLGLGSR